MSRLATSGRIVGSPDHLAGSSLSVSLQDPDAAAYISASGATDRQNINLFFRGLKQLGIYSSLVDAWLLPSSQNKGSGSTAYGMKLAYPMTLFNGPTWGSTGLTLTTTSYGSISYAETIPSGTPLTILYCGIEAATNRMRTNVSYLTDYYGGLFPTPGEYICRINSLGALERIDASIPFIYANRGTNLSVASPSNAGWCPAANEKFWFAASKNSNTQMYFYKNTATVGSATLGANTENIVFGNTSCPIGNPSNSPDVGGVASFCLLSKTALTPSLNTQLYTLYKQTVGQSLGLP